jgi:hypothetical protein
LVYEQKDALLIGLLFTLIFSSRDGTHMCGERREENQKVKVILKFDQDQDQQHMSCVTAATICPSEGSGRKIILICA